ncbi:MAG: hypothetical protein WD030_05475 [Pirellulales bacterium]
MKDYRLTLRWPQVLLHRRTILVPACVLYVIGLEYIGRRLTTDIGDAACLSATALFGLACWAIWRGSLTARDASRQLRQLVERLKELVPKRGYDLRDSPPLPRGVPGSALGWTLLAVMAAVAAFLAAAYFPHAARDWLAPRCYTAYLLMLGTLWLAIFFFGTMSVFAALGDLYDQFAAVFPGNKPRSLRPWWIVQGVLVLAFVTAGMTLPLSVAVMILIGVGIATLLATPLAPRGRPRLVWRNEDNVAHSAPLWIMNIAAFTRMLAVALTIIFLAGGTFVVGSQQTTSSEMPLTQLMGTLFAWSAVAFALMILRLQWTVSLVGSRLTRRQAATLHVQGKLSRQSAKQWKETLGRLGWRVHFARSPRELDVRAIADEASLPLDPWEPPRWPLPLSLAELESKDTQFRLRRRDEIQKRRHLLRVLSRLFKHAARHKYEEGSGYFLGLHLWYVLGLVRDEPETRTYDRYDTLLHDIIGPPYWRAFPLAVRQHFRDICEALAIDLIYIEDGVTYRRFVRVVRAMFEHYDMHGGQEPAEERHFTGLPGVRVVIHDLKPEVAPDFQQYPEPEYDDISRARVLHVFRDRGEMEAMDEIPIDFSDVPVPVGVLS